MKKLTLILALGLTLLSGSAFGSDSRYQNHYGYVSPGRSNSLDSRIERLNRMLTHVRWELSRYRGDWRLRREVERISSDVSRVNMRYRRGNDSWRLRSEVDSLRAQLHRIEVRLHVRNSDYYRWD
ncbi:MAG TPA: hypothetical protein VJ721_03155 [Chthoniobacterales bacterium]|nr:hypothetical protein [Chthoniobacterales bacterium]